MRIAVPYRLESRASLSRILTARCDVGLRGRPRRLEISTPKSTGWICSERGRPASKVATATALSHHSSLSGPEVDRSPAAGYSHREAIHIDSCVIWIIRGCMSVARLIHEVAETVENSAALVDLHTPQPVRTMADDERGAGVDGLLCEGSEELGGLVAVVARLVAMDRQHDSFGDCASATYFGQNQRRRRHRE